MENQAQMNRRDLLLQEMGISQWQLRRPEVLKGAVNIAVGSHIRLIIICEEAQDNQPFLRDLFRSAALSDEQYLWVNSAQAQHLSVQHPCHYWFFAQNDEKTDRTLPEFPQAMSCWSAESLSVLKQSATEKRALWQHIQQHLLRDD